MAVVATLSKGYDLNYIWNQVDLGPVKDAAGSRFSQQEAVAAVRDQHSDHTQPS